MISEQRVGRFVRSLGRNAVGTLLLALFAIAFLSPALAVTTGSVGYLYDEAGRLKSAVYNNGAGEAYTLDAAGNRKSTTQAGPGGMLPGAPGTPTFSAITATSATVSWTAATGLGGVASYDSSFNGGAWTSLGNVLSAALSGLSPSTSYSFAVRARDAVGNIGPTSTASFSTTADTTAPTAPGIPTFSNITTSTATVTWTASTDNVGVTSYEYQKNGGAWTSVGNVLTKNLTGLTAATQYTIGIHAKDAAGNTSNTSSASFTTHTLYTDTPVMTVGGPIALGTGASGGFISGSYGSMSPTSTTNGFLYKQLTDNYLPPKSGGGFLAATFSVSGFTSDPGATWLTSVKVGTGSVHTGTTAAYSYASGVATWQWTTTAFAIGAGSVTCTIVHY